MPFTFTNLGGDAATGADATSYASGSVTPTASRLLLLGIEGEFGGTITAPSVSGLGLTWSEIAGYEDDTSGTHVYVSLWGALTGGSPSSGTVTVDWSAIGTMVGCSIIIDEVSGADISSTVANAVSPQAAVTGSANSGGTSETATLGSAPTSGNATYALFHHQTNEATTPDTANGWVELGDVSHSVQTNTIQTQRHSTGAQACIATWASTGIRGSIIIELKSATSSSTAAIINYYDLIQKRRSAY